MAEEETSADAHEVTFQWIQIAQAVARGRLAPEEGVARLRALADEYPADRDWLWDEIETIRRQFALDVAEDICNGQGSYWDKMGSIMQALLDERLDHERALELLWLIDADHPEHAEQTARLIDGIANSPLRRLLETDD
jgi:hypothetical protein